MRAMLIQLALRQLRKSLHLFKSDSLFRNAVFLMASTAIMSVLGFGFWIFVAHLYAPEDTGSASALISITLLISNLSFFGLNTGFIRFLSGSKHRSGDINASLITTAVAAMVAAVGYLTFAHTGFSGDLSTVMASDWGKALFVLLMAAVSLNTLTDSIFIASRRAEFHTIIYTVFGLVKLILPLFLVNYGALGVFAAYIAAVVASLTLTFFFLWRWCDYHPLTRPHWGFITQTRRFAMHNYVAVLFAGLPSQLMPTLIINRLGEAPAAYFAMAWTMANLLYVIPSAITNSLLAEAAHDSERQTHNVRHAAKILTVILVPTVIVAIAVSPFLLTLFGDRYADGGTVIFQIMAFATFLIAGNSIGNTIMNIQHRSGGVLMVQFVIALVTTGLAWPLMSLGLPGVGWAMLAGQFAGTITQVALLMRRQRSEPAEAQAAA